MRVYAVTVGVLLLGSIAPAHGSVRRQPDKAYRLVLKHHRFRPLNITVPAGKRIKVIIDNRQPVPAVITSFVLNRQKLVTAHHRIVLYLPPMGAGTYTLFDDFHLSTKGTVTVR